MDYQLVVIRGRSASQVLKLGDGITTVGRSEGCTLRIRSSQVSRKHCEIFEKKGLLLVKDLGSSNGTIVNGKKVEGQRVVEPGDVLLIGSVKLRVAKAGEVIATPAAAAKPSGPKPADTAVAEAALGLDVEIEGDASDGDDQEFDIDFDDETVASDVKTPAPTPAAGTKSPAPSKAAAPKTEPTPAPKAKAKAKAEEPAAEPDAADDAIADFLMGIQLDDDDKT